MVNKEATGDSQHSFTMGKSCLTSLVTFCNKAIALVDKGRATDVTCLDLYKVFDTVLHNTLVSKLETHGSDGWTTWWIKNWLDGRTLRVVVTWLDVQVETTDEWRSSGGQYWDGAV